MSPSSRTFLVLTMLLMAAPTVMAQTSPQASRPAGSRLPWPSTGGGQPDFEFERSETFTEAAKDAKTQGISPPILPKLADLLEDFALDPLGLMAAELTTPTTVSGTNVLSETTVLSLSDPAFANLPGRDAQDTNLTEFTANLQRTAQQFVANWQPRLAEYSLDYLLRGLTLQAVVTSPQTFAVINNQQYQVGDSFVVPFTLAVPDVELLGALEATMPTPDTLPPAAYAKYVQVYEGIIAQLAQLKNSNPQAFQHTQNVPVTITGIEKRKVILNLNGTRQELAFTHAY